MQNAQEDLEASLALNPCQIISIELQDLVVNNAGDFIALIFKIQHRENSKTNDLYKIIYAPKIEKATEFREVQGGSIMNSHRRQASGAIKGMITGVTGYMSSRFKDHQRSQTQVFDEKKMNQQPAVAQRATMAVRPEWRTDCEPLMSKLGAYAVKKGKRVLSQEIESLAVVRTSLETKFLQVASLTGEDPC